MKIKIKKTLNEGSRFHLNPVFKNPSLYFNSEEFRQELKRIISNYLKRKGQQIPEDESVLNNMIVNAKKALIKKVSIYLDNEEKIEALNWFISSLLEDTSIIERWAMGLDQRYKDIIETIIKDRKFYKYISLEKVKYKDIPRIGELLIKQSANRILPSEKMELERYFQ